MSEWIRSYQDLLVWKKGMLLIDEIDRIVTSLMPMGDGGSASTRTRKGDR